MTETEKAYIAGLFDGEGSVTCIQRKTKRNDRGGKIYIQWDIRCEMSMTDRYIMEWVYEKLGFGSLKERKAHKSWLGKKTQWRWRCGFRDAYSFAKIVWPHVQVKLHKIEQIIDHYSPEDQSHKGENVVNLEDYR